MCGIIGVVAATGRARTWVDEHVDDLRHRGPDDKGRFESADSRVVFGHRRLAIIDLTPGGHQPMASPDGSVTLVWNGEIYNHVELRSELERLGHAFGSRSDTEVLLCAYLQWGRACVDRLVGMWALALHDARTRSVWLSRDPFGIKPLYFTILVDGLAFASEPDPLVDLVQPRVDPQVAFDFLCWGHVDRSASTFVRSIQQVPSGGSVVVGVDTPGSVGITGPDLTLRGAPDPDRTYPETVRELRRLLVRSVEWHMRSDVRIGSALSGGLDSSTIVMLMREIAGDELDLHAFSFVSPGDEFDESQFAAAVSDASRAIMHPVQLSEADVAETAGRVAEAQFEPFASLSILAQYAVFREAQREGVTVMLDGQGADELLAGYPVFMVDHLVDLLRRAHFRAAWRMAGRVAEQLGAGAVARAFARALPRPAAVPLWQRWMRRSVPPWVDLEWFAQQGVAIAADPRDLPASFDSAVERSVTTSSLPGLLRYEDRNSMAHSIESRVPFLTLELARFAATVPAAQLYGPDRQRKSLLSDAMRGVVPDVVVERRRKVAFAVPERRWLEGVDLSGPEVDGIRRQVPAIDTRAWSYRAFLGRIGC